MRWLKILRLLINPEYNSDSLTAQIPITIRFNKLKRDDCYSVAYRKRY